MNIPTQEKKGLFIVLEGCEGAGKTTQVKNLREKYPDAVFFREPGGTEFAEEMRNLVLTSKHCKDLSAYEQMNLVCAGRSNNIRNIIGPALDAGKLLFADRYDSSTFAYQIFGMDDKSLFELFGVQRLSMGPLSCLPDLYVILDISPEEGMKRVASRREAEGKSNHFDDRGPEFHARVRAGYHRFAELYPGKVKIVDAHPSKEEVWESVQEAVDSLR